MPPLEPSTRDSVDDRGFFGHPKGLAVLFFTEMWERFSFYGMRALLTLYMIKALGYDKDNAYLVYGAYGALVYAFPVVGGYLANKWLGYRNAIVLGGTLMALGHFAMAVEHQVAFYMALALLSVGNGFFKPNVSSTVGRLYEEGDARRDRGFTIFYMSINLGALLSPLVCGNLGEKVGWHYGFGAAGVGMVLGLIWFIRGQRHIGRHGDPDDTDKLLRPLLFGLNRLHLTWIGSLAIAPLVAGALYRPEITDWVVKGVSGIVLAILLGFVFALKGTARKRMIALLALMFFHMLFFAGFEQAGSSFTTLADVHVRRAVLGFEIPASVLQSVNPTFIVLLSVPFVLLWRFLSRIRKNPSIPVKFAAGLFQLGLGFWVLSFGIEQMQVNEQGVATIGLGWLILCYFLHTTGELWISPIGLSAVTKLTPTKWTGFCMGAWFLTIANAHLVAAWIAGLTGTTGAKAETKGPEALQQYAGTYDSVFYVLLGAAAVLLLLSPILTRLIGDVDGEKPEPPRARVVEE